MSPARKPSTRAVASEGDVATETFEASFAALQTLVQQLEAGGLTLEQAVELCDRGSRLADQCDQLIAHAELRITRLPAEPAST